MNNLDKWEELKQRLGNAATQINVLAVENKVADEVTRLFGKCEGVALALEHMRELDDI